MNAFEVTDVVCQECLDKLTALSPLFGEFAIGEFVFDDGTDYTCSTCDKSFN